MQVACVRYPLYEIEQQEPNGTSIESSEENFRMNPRLLPGKSRISLSFSFSPRPYVSKRRRTVLQVAAPPLPESLKHVWARAWSYLGLALRRVCKRISDY